jgi:hypothetical protein
VRIPAFSSRATIGVTVPDGNPAARPISAPYASRVGSANIARSTSCVACVIRSSGSSMLLV